jgi:hypothetical protein
MIPLSPELVALAIRSAIRLGSAGRDAYEQHVRDADFTLPFSPALTLSPLQLAEELFTTRPDAIEMVTSGPLVLHWDADKQRALATPEARRSLIEAADVYWQAHFEPNDQISWAAIRLSQEQSAGFVLRQWNDEDGPPPPLARVALAVAEVGLDFIGTNPGVFGVGGNGEKLVGAMAANLAELLPDPDDPRHWPKAHFVERTSVIVMHAGLKTLGEHPEFVADEKHVRELIRNITRPLVERFDASPAQAPRLIELRDTLFGPVATAAFETLLEHQTAFLGDRFASDRAVSAVTSALLGEASRTAGLQELVSSGGLMRLYKSALGVAVERPELFIGDDRDEQALADEMLVGVASALRGAEDVFSKDTLGNLAAIALDVGGRYAMETIGDGTPWQQVAGLSLEHFLAGLERGLADASPEAFSRLLSRGQVVELARIVLEQAGATPGMLVGRNAGPEVEAIVSGIARSMAADGDLLLSGDDWLKIAAVAAEEAARNPGRLFGLAPGDPTQELAAELMQGILGAAAEGFRERGRGGGSVLFGRTLRGAIAIALHAAAGDSARFAARVSEVVALVERLDQLVSRDPRGFGADEWLFLFEGLVTEVAEGLDPTTLGADELAERLKG